MSVDPTPNWSMLLRTNLSAHEDLITLASERFENQRRGLGSQLTSNLSLASAKAAGLAIETADGPAFADAVVEAEYLARHAYTAQTADWRDPAVFAARLAEVQQATLAHEAGRSVSRVLVAILASEGVDVLGHAAILAATRDGKASKIWSVYDLLCHSIPVIECTAPKFVASIMPVIDAVRGDLTEGLIFEAVRNWAGVGKERAQTLLSHVIDDKVATLVPVAVAGFAQFDRDTAHATALKLVDDADNSVRSAAIVALAAVGYKPAEDALLAETLARYDELLASRDAAIDGSLTQAYYSLLQTGADVRYAFVELSTRPDSATRFALSLVLFRSANDHATDKWWLDTLFNLSATPASDAGTYRYIDYAVSRLAKVSPAAAVRFLELVATAAANTTRREDLLELLPGVMQELHKNSVATLEEAITRWFDTENEKLHRIAAQIIHDHAELGRSTTGDNLILNLRSLDGRPDSEVLKVLQRALGWVIGGRALATLVTSLLRTPSPSPVMAQAVGTTLVEIVLYNYPGGAGDYLRERLGALPLDCAEATTIASALAASDAYYARIRTLPEVKELRPTQPQLYLLRVERMAMNAMIAEEARKKSVFMNLIRRVPLKYGRSFSNDVDADLANATPLNTFSHSLELPRGEVIDPIGQLILRIRLRQAMALQPALFTEAE